MAIGCGAKFAKVMLIIFNILFLCTGLVLMAVGIWLLVTLAQSWGPSQIFSLASDSYLYRNSAILLIAMGCFILFITVLGLVAAIKESVILLSILAVLIFLVFAGEIAGGVIAIVYKDMILIEIDSTLKESLAFNGNTSYYETVPDKLYQCKASAIGKLWDYVQLWFGCCGIRAYDNGYTLEKINPCNTTKVHYPKKEDQRMPLTCCTNTAKIGNFDPEHQEDYIDSFNCTTHVPSDCTDEVKAWIVKFAPILIGIGIGFGMLEMFGFIFTICLCMNTDKGFKKFRN